MLYIGRGTVFTLLKALREHSEFYPSIGAKQGRLRSLDNKAEEVSYIDREARAER